MRYETAKNLIRIGIIAIIVGLAMIAVAALAGCGTSPAEIPTCIMQTVQVPVKDSTGTIIAFRTQKVPTCGGDVAGELGGVGRP